ncbi:MAG TPA: OmpH family outer membrane protein [Nitrospirae bacterium]|nr:OmpH family outer membrane protein [Nitrospirota bacterium]
MKRAVMVFFLILLFQGVVYAVDVKIGYVDLQKALNESEGGKRAKSSLEEIIKAKQKVIDERGAEIEKLKSEIDKQASLLSPEALKKKQDELDRKIREYKRFVQDSQEEVKKKEAELTNEILKDLVKVVKKIGKEEKYTIILEKAEGLILYADNAIDLTDKVIKRYNEEIKTKK